MYALEQRLDEQAKSAGASGANGAEHGVATGVANGGAAAPKDDGGGGPLPLPFAAGSSSLAAEDAASAADGRRYIFRIDDITHETSGCVPVRHAASPTPDYGAVPSDLSSVRAPLLVWTGAVAAAAAHPRGQRG